MPHPSNLTQGILTKRIPCWPFADPKGRHIVGWDEYTLSTVSNDDPHVSSASV